MLEQDDATTTATDDSAGAPASQNAGPATTTEADNERRFTQAQVDAAINNRLARERKAAEEKTAKERLAAEQKALAENNEFKTLAERHAARLAQLEPELEVVTTKHAALAEKINRQIEQGIRDWPAEARKMVPASDDVAARLDAYENMRQLLDGGRLSGRQPGNGTGPRPTAGPAASEKTEELLRSNPRYSAL
jgi:uncharacterized protein YdaU (DUF1376 family)